MGTPGKVKGVRFDEATMRELEQLAAQDERSISFIIRRLVKAGLAEAKKRKKHGSSL